jgi:hypothetical protein
MAGDIRSKERSAVTLTSSGSSLTNGSAGSAGTDLDLRASGNGDNDLEVVFELLCQWGTITGIVKDTTVAALYLVPKFDGTNAADIDTTSGTSALPPSAFGSSFVATKAPTASTNARFVSDVVPLHPMLYTAYILNKSGQTISANWTLKALGAAGRYT